MRGKIVAIVLAGAAVVAAGCGAPAEPEAQAAGLPLAPSPELPTPPVRHTPPSPSCSVVTGACASLSLRRAWLMENGRAVRSVPMEPGGPGQPTPAGTFRVAWKDRVHRSDEYGDEMPNSVFFAPGGIAFHAGPLDRPSHGCIHLADEDAALFFDRLPVGAEVEVDR
ncbi:L,D-transpeptidase [Amycolatopsis sp. A1MSW2902]|uniref:L,D-transpeptidase n=1 Tax=Amycolatopsis sp. A1MSW2902 TaxID=687413 RepID=UPI00307FAF10